MWERPAFALSGGNKRKVSLAVALVGAPAVVLLDEPSSGDERHQERTCDVQPATRLCHTIQLRNCVLQMRSS
jgi:energy-coupling factor transporter ATP-binding protein EcfA2